MPTELTDAAARSAKASKTLDTMRARIVKADEARTDAAHNARAAQVAEAANALFDSPLAVAGHLEGRGGVAGVVVAEYEGLTVSVLSQPAKKTGKDRLWVQRSSSL